MSAEHDTAVSFIYDLTRALREGAELPEYLAAQFAEKAAAKLCERLGGLYIPKSHISKPARNSAIRRDFNGRNHAEVMRKYRISRATLYRVIGNWVVE